MNEVTQSINRMTGAIMVLQEERQKLRQQNQIPPRLHGLLAELRARDDRWLRVLDEAKTEVRVEKPSEMEIWDDVPLEERR